MILLVLDEERERERGRDLFHRGFLVESPARKGWVLDFSGASSAKQGRSFRRQVVVSEIQVFEGRSLLQGLMMYTDMFF